MNKILVVSSIILMLLAVAWKVVIAPLVNPSYLALIPYTTDIFSVDNFYNVSRQEYEGEITSQTLFSYEVVDTSNDIATIRNIFDVRTLDNEPIVNIQREYGVSSETGAHLSGQGDKDRSGHLFAPPNLQKGESFIYWHINYDAPATMVYEGEEKIHGLTTYKYYADYSGYTIDQTDILTHLPGVPEKWGIVLEPQLWLWIEPETGQMVQYSDDTTAYYYDQQTGTRMHPWNHFKNETTPASTREAVLTIQRLKFTTLLQNTIFPSLLVIVAGILFIASLLKISPSQKVRIAHTIALLAAVVTLVGSVSVMSGWILGIDLLKRFYPGLVTMKFSTAFSFLVSSIILFAATQKAKHNEMFADILVPAASLILYLIMGILLAASVFGFESGIESLFVKESRQAILTSLPGRPSIGTMLAFLMIALLGTHTLLPKNYPLISRGLSSVLIFLSILAFNGYLLGIPSLYFVLPDVSSGMAIHTAALFLLLGIGFICTATPEEKEMQ